MTQSSLPLTYPDLVCTDDLDPFASETTSDLQTLVQDVMHQLIEWPGTNPDDPDGGVGIERYLNGRSSDLQAAPGVIEQKLIRDDRIDACTATVSAPTAPDGQWIIATELTVDGAVVPLSFGWSQAAGLTFLGGA